MGVSKWQQYFHFWVNYSFNCPTWPHMMWLFSFSSHLGLSRLCWHIDFKCVTSHSLPWRENKSVRKIMRKWAFMVKEELFAHFADKNCWMVWSAVCLTLVYKLQEPSWLWPRQSLIYIVLSAFGSWCCMCSHQMKVSRRSKLCKLYISKKIRENLRADLHIDWIGGFNLDSSPFRLKQ